MQYLLAINFMDNLINFFEYIFLKKSFMLFGLYLVWLTECDLTKYFIVMFSLFSIYLIVSHHIIIAVQLGVQGSGKVLWGEIASLKVTDFREKIENSYLSCKTVCSPVLWLGNEISNVLHSTSILYSATIS